MNVDKNMDHVYGTAWCEILVLNPLQSHLPTVRGKRLEFIAAWVSQWERDYHVYGVFSALRGGGIASYQKRPRYIPPNSALEIEFCRSLLVKCSCMRSGLKVCTAGGDRPQPLVKCGCIRSGLKACTAGGDRPQPLVTMNMPHPSNSCGERRNV